MPLVLFLVDYKRDLVPEEEYYEEDLNYPEEGEYVYNMALPASRKIDNNFIFISDYIYNKEFILESEEKEFDKSGESKFEEIKKILLRFYCYHNDLGDQFSIGKGKVKIKYDLTQFYHLNTFNICCIGRNGSGKSTFINYIFNHTKAKIFNKRESYTKRVNVHNSRSSDVPLKIFEIPGFNDNNSSISNAASKLTKLNKKLSEIKDELHLILYFFKSDELYMFKEEEYELIKSIPNEKNLKLIYIFTNSKPYTNKNEIMYQINDFIQKFLVTLKFEKGFDLFNKMKAHENNCIFVNFYPKENPFGVKELLH
jgi:GTP-binding protein EngB required for normal cell division